MIRVSETLAFTARLPASQAVCVTRRLAAAASSTAAVDIMAGKLKNSSLLTPDPYHVPGYCGYVPQFKYKLGETFGWHTHKLLTDQSVASSGVPILANTSFPSVPSTRPRTKEDFFKSALGSRTRSWGDQKYAPQMVPGYTGLFFTFTNSLLPLFFFTRLHT